MNSYRAAPAIVDSSKFRPNKLWGFNEIQGYSSSDLPEPGPDYRETVEEEIEIFKKEVEVLIKRWTREVEDMSSFSDMFSHADYMMILAKGSKVIPVLFDELQHRPHYWFGALQILIKANYGLDVDPVNEEDRGNLLKMANAWLAWREEEFGHI